MTTKFFAIADANGLISHELESDNLSGAKSEMAAAIESGEVRNWIDSADTDLEDELGCVCPGISAARALTRCESRGAKFECGENTSDSWDIWSVDVD